MQIIVFHQIQICFINYQPDCENISAGVWTGYKGSDGCNIVLLLYYKGRRMGYEGCRYMVKKFVNFMKNSEEWMIRSWSGTGLETG